MKPSQTCILTISCGSSSIKFVLYQRDELLKRCLDGKVDRIGLPGTNLTFNDLTQNQHDSRGIKAPDHRSAADLLIVWLEERIGFASLKAVGHRVVHGMRHTTKYAEDERC